MFSFISKLFGEHELKSSLDGIFSHRFIIIFGEDHNNQYARVALLDFIKKNPDLVKKMTFYVEGINDGILQENNFETETQYFNKNEIGFFKQCLLSGIDIRGIESTRTSPLKKCKSKESVLESSKPFITNEEYKQLSQYVSLGESIMSLLDFKSLAQKFISKTMNGIRKNFDEDAPKIIDKYPGREIEIVICGYEHMNSLKKSIHRKPVLTIAVGSDGTEYKPDRMISHDEKKTLRLKS